MTSAANSLQNMAHHAAVVFSLQNSSYLLFSESVVIVEGKTEKMLVPDMYQAIRKMSLARSKTCLIEVCGSSSIAPTMEVLLAVGFKSKAIVDLDYLFKKAPNFVQNLTNDTDFLACKAWFAANSATIGFKLGGDGFPEKNGTFSAAAVFELMAKAMPPEVQRLASRLLAQGFWVWTLGAIEAHLGIGKTDADRMIFANSTRTNGNLSHANDAVNLTACMNWI